MNINRLHGSPEIPMRLMLPLLAQGGMPPHAWACLPKLIYERYSHGMVIHFQFTIHLLPSTL